MSHCPRPTWNSDDPAEFAYLILVTVSTTTAAWLIVTLLTPPEPVEKLLEFYERVRPAGPGWRPVAAARGKTIVSRESLVTQFANWLLGCTLVYASLFGIGKLIFQEWLTAGACLLVAIVSSLVISRNLSRADWQLSSVSE